MHVPRAAINSMRLSKEIETRGQRFGRVSNEEEMGATDLTSRDFASNLKASQEERNVFTDPRSFRSRSF